MGFVPIMFLKITIRKSRYLINEKLQGRVYKMLLDVFIKLHQSIKNVVYQLSTCHCYIRVQFMSFHFFMSY